MLIPTYYRDFSCKCGACRHVCCQGWGISVTEQEYFRLIGMPCKKHLRHKIDDALCREDAPDAGKFARIVPGMTGFCPMLDTDGYCMLQREYGEGVLPLICRVYPRSVRLYGEIPEISCSCSCEKTIELLTADTAPVTLIEDSLTLPFPGVTVYARDEEKDRLRRACVAQIADRRYPLRTRIGAIGTMLFGTAAPAAQDAAAALARIRRFITAFEPRSLSIFDYGSRALDTVSSLTDSEAYEHFRAEEVRMRALIPEIDTYAEKIIVNHMLYESFPFVPDCRSTDRAFAAFCFAAALMKFICVSCVSTASTREGALQSFTDVIAEVYRFIEHSDFYGFAGDAMHREDGNGFGTFAVLSPMFD